MIMDIKYAIKVVQCVLSGYQFLEHKSDNNEWEPIGVRLAPDGPALYPHFELEDWPHYVCAVFGNKRHIPLPLVLGDYEDDVGPWQRIALWLVKGSGEFREAQQDCAYYEHQWNTAEAVSYVPRPA